MLLGRFRAHSASKVAYSITSGVVSMIERLSTYYFYPWGSRQLHLTYPAQRGTDIWLLERWLNRVRELHPAWSLGTLPEQGILRGELLLQIKQLAKRLLVWQPRQIGELTYSLFGLEVGQSSAVGNTFGLRPLLTGDVGHDVWVLQNRLVSVNRRFALILGRPADGVYDQRTARLVRAFQREYQPLFPIMRATGQVFSDSMLAVWDRTLLGGRILSLGSRGLDVLALQELLSGFGLSCSGSGIFDVTTAEQLAAWQRRQGVAGNGVFDAATCWQLGLLRGY